MKLGYVSNLPDGADAARATPLVLLHAYPTGSAMWRHQLEHFGRSRPVYALDLRGYGKSASHDGTPFHVNVYASDIHETLSHLGVTRAVVGGCSMGGYTLFELWRQQPDLIAGMILADTRAEADNDDTRAKRAAQIQKVQKEGTGWLPDFVAENLLGESTRKGRPEVVQEVKGIVSQASAGTVTGTLEMLASRPDSGPTLPTINVPTLVVVGEEDTVTPRELSERMARDIPKAELAIIPEAGHLSPLENPVEFNRVVEAFLGRVGSKHLRN